MGHAGGAPAVAVRGGPAADPAVAGAARTVRRLRHAADAVPYLAAGRPILTPEATDTAELLEHGETAWLVPRDRPDAAALALDRLLADPALGRDWRLTR